MMKLREKPDSDRLISLKVKKAFKEDVGRLIARVDPEIIKTKNLSIGGIVLLIGKKFIPAVIIPSHPSDSGKSIVRISKTFRKNLGVDIGDEIRIKKAEVREAEKIVVTITTTLEPSTLERLENKILDALEGKAVIQGQEIDLILPYFKDVLRAIISFTKPKGIVRVGRATKIGIDHIVYKNPVSLLKVWEGEEVIVHTIGEIFEGKLAGFDDDLNVFLKDARILDTDTIHKVLVLNGANIISVQPKEE